MADDEQRVKTMAGWVGVEVSKSRVRTAGRAGYGLYRVRGSRPIPRALGTLGAEMKSFEWCDWTAYVFKLAAIQLGVEVAIRTGEPSKPGDLTLPAEPAGGRDTAWITVPTRWTQAYRGRRDLGVGASFRAGAYLESKPETVRQRQRAYNAAFQAAHKERRKYGLKRRHALKAVWVRQQQIGNIAADNVSGPLSP